MFEKLGMELDIVTNQVVQGNKSIGWKNLAFLIFQGLLAGLLIVIMLDVFGYVIYDTGSAFDISRLYNYSFVHLIFLFAGLVLEDLMVLLPILIVLNYFRFPRWSIILIGSVAFSLLHFANGNMSLFGVLGFTWINLFHLRAWIDHGLSGGAIWHIFYNLAIFVSVLVMMVL